MADPISVPLELDPAEVESRIYSYIQSFYPEWNPKEPHLVVLMSEAFASEVSELRRLATDVGPEIFRYFGGLVGVDPIDALPATGTVNITVRDTAGYTIPVGTQMRVRISGNDYIGFETLADATVPAGSTTVTGVAVTATSDGAEGNGLTAPPELLDLLDFVSSIALVGATSGGQDQETTDDYLVRLESRLRLMADRPIVPRDFEIYVENLVPGVYRALCLDGYNPSNNTYNNERMVTMVALDTAGNGVNTTVKAEMVDILEAARELTFVVNTMDPTYTAVTVSATVRAFPGWDTVTVDDNVTAAVADYLNPANWGKPVIAGTVAVEERRWVKQNRVRYGEIYSVINAVEGVDYIDGAVTINGATNTDLVLAGEAPLPAANPTVNVTVLPPA